MPPESGRSTPYCFVGLNGELKGRVIPLAPGMSLGRCVTADVFLPDPSLGRRHCRVDQSPAGYFVLTAKRESPVLVDGEPQRSVPLAPGNIVALGRFQLRVEKRSLAPPAPTPEPPLRIKIPPTTVADERQGGALLIAKTHWAGDTARLAPVFNQLARRARRLASRAEGNLIAADPDFLRLWWTCPPNSATPPIRAAMRLALGLHRLAFLVSTPHARVELSLGGAAGVCAAARLRRDQTWLIGDSVNRAIDLALEAKPSTTLFDGTGAEPAVAAPTESFAGRPIRRVFGLPLAGQGRRRKFRLSQFVHLTSDHHVVDALLTRGMIDPTSRSMSLTLLTRSPLEVGAWYQLPVAGGPPTISRCRSCQPLVVGSGFRAWLKGAAGHDVVAGILDRLVAEYPGAAPPRREAA